METQSGSILHGNRRHLHPANTGQVVISSKDESVVTESDDPHDEPSHDVLKSTQEPHPIVSNPTGDVGLSSGSPYASQKSGIYQTRSGHAVIRPARFTE